MKKIIDGFITFILIIILISVFGIITYVCLEFFEIIEVPEQYSLMKYIESKTEIISSVQDFIQTTVDDEKYEDVWKDTNTVIVELSGNSVTTIYLEDFYQDGEQQNQQIYVPSDFKFYDQLDENAKKIYDALEKDKELLKSGIYTFDFDTEFNDLLNQENGDKILNNAFQLAVNSFAYDHPEIFYIDIEEMYLLTEITTRPFSTTYRVSVGPNGESYLFDQYASEADLNLAIQQIEQTKNEIIQNASGNIYEKIKYVHDYLVESTEYEQTVQSHNNYNIYGTFINRKAVCEGYAKAFKYVLDELKIPCVMICGVARNSAGNTEKHAWNYVEIDGKWYAVDVTWDDPIIIGEGYVPKSTKYKYFLKGSNSLFTDHKEDGNILDVGTLVYPSLSDTDY